MKDLVILSLLLALAASVPIIRSYRKIQREKALRLAPLPSRTVIECTLPRDVTDSTRRMAMLFGRLASIEFDIVYLAQTPPSHLTPRLSFYVTCDPSYATTVRRALKTVFQTDISMKIHDQDPLAFAAETLRARALAEHEHHHDDPVEHEESA